MRASCVSIFVNAFTGKVSHDIKIKSIKGSKVTLIVTDNNTEKTKTINIDWITD
jgi:hypothetical protein